MPSRSSNSNGESTTENAVHGLRYDDVVYHIHTDEDEAESARKSKKRKSTRRGEPAAAAAQRQTDLTFRPGNQSLVSGEHNIPHEVGNLATACQLNASPDSPCAYSTSEDYEMVHGPATVEAVESDDTSDTDTIFAVEHPDAGEFDLIYDLTGHTRASEAARNAEPSDVQNDSDSEWELV